MPNAVRIRTSSGWQDIALTGPAGPAGANALVFEQPNDPGVQPSGALWIDTDEPPLPSTNVDFSTVPLLIPGTNTRNTFVDVAGRALMSAQVTGDTVRRWVIDTSGTMTWGPGNAATDTNLYRVGVGSLETTGIFNFRLASAASIGPQMVVSGDTYARLNIQANGKLQWGPGNAAQDVSFYRSGPNTLRLDNALQMGALGAPNLTIGSICPGDSQYRFYVTGDGSQYWGPGGAGAVDTALYRGGVGVLSTGATTTFQLLNSGGAAVYPFQVIVSGDTTFRFGVRGDGLLHWGPGNGAQDTYIYRSAVNQLSMSGALGVAGMINGQSNIYACQGSGYQVFMGNVFSCPAVQFGYSATAVLYSPAANEINNYNGSYGTFRAAVFAVSSDRKLKRDVKRHEFAIDKLLDAGIYTFKRKGSDERDLGLMSDELPDEVTNTALDPEGGEDLRFVDLYKLSAAMLAAIQQLDKRLTKAGL